MKGAVPWQWNKLPQVGIQNFTESDEYVNDCGL